MQKHNVCTKGPPNIHEKHLVPFFPSFVPSAFWEELPSLRFASPAPEGRPDPRSRSWNVGPAAGNSVVLNGPGCDLHVSDFLKWMKWITGCHVTVSLMLQ